MGELDTFQKPSPNFGKHLHTITKPISEKLCLTEQGENFSKACKLHDLKLGCARSHAKLYFKMPISLIRWEKMLQKKQSFKSMTYIAICCSISLECFGVNSVLSRRGRPNDSQERPRIYSYLLSDFHTNPQGPRGWWSVIFPNYSPVLGTASAADSPVQGRRGYNIVVLKKLWRRDYCNNLTCSRQALYNDHFG